MRQPYSNLLINTKSYTFAIDDTDSLRTKDYYYNLLFTTLYNNIFTIKNIAYQKEMIGRDNRCEQILIYQIWRMIDLMLFYKDNPTIKLEEQIEEFKNKFSKYGFGINVVTLFTLIGVTYNPSSTNTNNFIQLESSNTGRILLE